MKTKLLVPLCALVALCSLAYGSDPGPTPAPVKTEFAKPDVTAYNSPAPLAYTVYENVSAFAPVVFNLSSPAYPIVKTNGNAAVTITAPAFALTPPGFSTPKDSPLAYTKPELLALASYKRTDAPERRTVNLRFYDGNGGGKLVTLEGRRDGSFTVRQH